MEAVKILDKGGLNFRRMGGILHLPDGTTLTIYKKDLRHENVYRSRKELKEHTGRLVNFSDQVMLLDHRLERTDRGYKLGFFWECLDTINQDYKVFVHFYSTDDSPVLNADHRPHAKYPTNEWRKGEGIKDELDLASPLPETFP